MVLSITLFIPLTKLDSPTSNFATLIKSTSGNFSPTVSTKEVVKPFSPFSSGFSSEPNPNLPSGILSAIPSGPYPSEYNPSSIACPIEPNTSNVFPSKTPEICSASKSVPSAISLADLVNSSINLGSNPNLDPNFPSIVSSPATSFTLPATLSIIVDMLLLNISTIGPIFSTFNPSIFFSPAVTPSLIPAPSPSFPSYLFLVPKTSKALPAVNTLSINSWRAFVCSPLSSILEISKSSGATFSPADSIIVAIVSGFISDNPWAFLTTSPILNNPDKNPPLFLSSFSSSSFLLVRFGVTTDSSDFTSTGAIGP